MLEEVHFADSELKDMIVLIVDDNVAFRRLIRHALTGMATEIFECLDGADALAAYMAHRPSVVLMDISMPRLNGLAATRHIRQLDAAARVVIVTECDDKDIRQSAGEAGACGYILKQNLIDLRQLVDSMMSNPSKSRLAEADGNITS